MRFLLHGLIHPDTSSALVQHQHAAHSVAEFPDSPANTAQLLQAIAQKQWNLLTTDSEFVQSIYDQKIPFAGTVVLILAEDGQPQDATTALGRLFERYKRLSPRRLYTITPNRVKIRQLPGAATAE